MMYGRVYCPPESSTVEDARRRDRMNQLNIKLLSENAELSEKNDELFKMLQKMQWQVVGHEGADEIEQCPACLHYEREGHHEECELDVILKKYYVKE